MRNRVKWLLVAGALLVPATVTAGPRVDLAGESCRKCCEAYCPFDGRGYYDFCLPDLDGTTCIYNDNHYVSTGGC